MQLQHLKRCGAKINITGCEDYGNTFARIESDCTLRFDFFNVTFSSYFFMSHSLRTLVINYLGVFTDNILGKICENWRNH